MNIDSLLVSRCAPTLAGLKMAALICVPIESQSEYQMMVEEYNKRFNKQGLYFKTLWQCQNQRQVLYVYRQKEVQAYLTRSDVHEFIAQYGYEFNLSIDETIDLLISRFYEENTFPHEIGVFLGYPLEEVIAFVENKGENAAYCGEWKVYHNVEYAKEEFLKYNNCRRCYIDVYNQGFSMESLVVA